MKKFLAIIFLSLLWSNISYSNIIMQDLINVLLETKKPKSVEVAKALKSISANSKSYDLIIRKANLNLEDAKKIASELVAYLNEVSQIVDFFNKPDEIRRLKRKINDLILQTDHTDQELVNNITESFMDLARHKYV